MIVLELVVEWYGYSIQVKQLINYGTKISLRDGIVLSFDTISVNTNKEIPVNVG